MKYIEIAFLSIISLGLFLLYSGSNGGFISFFIGFFGLSILYFYLGFFYFNNLKIRDSIRNIKEIDIPAFNIVISIVVSWGLSILLCGICFNILDLPGNLLMLIVSLVLLGICLLIYIMFFKKRIIKIHTIIRMLLWSIAGLFLFINSKNQFIDIINI